MALSLKMDKTSSLEVWYLPEAREQQQFSQDILQTAYEQALTFHKATFASGDEQTWLSGNQTVPGVLEALKQAQEKYEAKKANRSKALAAVSSWWQKTASRIMHYEKVIDTIVSSHPEYSALVWGAMRFLFAITLSHQEMSTKLAQAFAEIGEMLPEIDFIASRLYPTEALQRTLAHIYAQILEFCVRATDWYQKVRQNLAKTVFRTIFKNWPLEFRDIREGIGAHRRRLYEQSTIAHQAETRDMHARLIASQAETRDIHAKLNYACGILQSNTQYLQQGFGMDATTIRPNPSTIDSLPFIKGRILPYLLSDQPYSPDQALQQATATRDRRRIRRGQVPNRIWSSAQIRDWISTPRSAILIVTYSSLRNEDARDLVPDIIQLLRSSGLPVIWYLDTANTRTAGTDTPQITTRDLIRSFISQIIQQQQQQEVNDDSFNAWRLSERDFASCTTDANWIRLFVSVMSQMKHHHHQHQLALVVDGARHELLGALYALWEQVEEEQRRQGVVTAMVVKMLVMADNGRQPTTLCLPAAAATVNMGSRAGGARTSPALLRAGRRRAGAIRALRGADPEALRPYVKLLIDSLSRPP
ncbi:hypothetical protein F4778DRAFT_356785 [Xylariomycetidae sp. FL2044]|nr:hypothetical protein F4778DRAFT_356785 [Xylariomycetidae sp. FL2044]